MSVGNSGGGGGGGDDDLTHKLPRGKGGDDYPNARQVSYETDGGVPTPTTIDSHSLGDIQRRYSGSSSARYSGAASPLLNPLSSTSFGSSLLRGVPFLAGRFSRSDEVASSFPHSNRRMTISGEIKPIVREAGQKFETAVRENEALRHELDLVQRELEYYRGASEQVERTNEHCRRLLERNSELEHMVARVQEPLLSQINELKTRAEAAEMKALSSGSDTDSLKRECDRQRLRTTETESERRRLERDLREARNELEYFQRQAARELGEQKALRARVERLIEENEQLRQAHRQQLQGLGNTSSEMAQLLRENERLTQLLKKASDDAQAQADQQPLRQLENELAELKNALSDAEARYNAAETHRAALEKQLEDLEGDAQQEFGQALAAAQEETARLQNAYDNDVQQLKQEIELLQQKLKALNEVHETAQQLLARNTELEKQLQKESANKDVVQKLQERLAESESSRLEAATKIRTLQSQNGILDRAVKDLEKQLAAVRAQMSNLTPSSPQGAGSPAMERAMKVALERTAAEHEAEVRALTEKYERVLSDLRKAHDQELRKLERELKAELRDMEKQKQAELEKAAREALQSVARDHMKQRKELHDSYERALADYAARMKAEMEKLLDEQRQQWQLRLKQKEDEADQMRQEYDDQLRQLEKEKDELIRQAAQEMDGKLAAKEQEISALRAELEAAKQQVENLLKFEPSQDIDAITRKFQDEIDTLTARLSEASAELRDARQQHQRELDELAQRRAEEVNELRKQLDDAVANAMARQVDSAKQFQDSLAPLISEATKELNAKLSKLQQDYLNAMRELSAAEEQRRQAELEAAKLTADVSHNAKTIDMLEKKLAEVSKAALEHSAKDGATLADPAAAEALKDQIRGLLNRNKQLEESIAAISEKYHNDLRVHYKEVRRLQDELARANRGLMSAGKASANRDLTPRRAVQEAKELRRQLDGTLDKLREAESKNNRLAQELALRVAEVDALRAQASWQSPADNEALLEKLEVIQRNIADALARDNETEKLAQEAAEARELRLKLGTQIDFLRNESDERQKRVRALEDQLRAMDKEPSTDGSKIEEALRLEREKLASTCRDLKERLAEQERLLEAETLNREQSLKSVEDHKKQLQDLLARNTKLEHDMAKALADLRARLNELGSASPEHNDLGRYINKFQNDLLDKARDHEFEAKKLADELAKSEQEINRLRDELDRLRAAADEARQLEADRKRLEEENERLRDSTTDLDDKLHKAQEELEKTKAFDADRMDSVMNELTKQLADHQRLLAKVQDDQEKELEAINEALAQSRQANEALQGDTERALREVEDRERELGDLNRAINDILAAAGPAAAARGSTPPPEQLKRAFNDLLDKTREQDKKLQRALESLQSMLGVQEAEIARVNETRENMSKLIANRLNDDQSQTTDMEKRSEELRNQIEGLTEQYQLIDDLKNRASANQQELSKLGNFLSKFITKGNLDPVEDSLRAAQGLAQTNNDEISTLLGQAKDASGLADEIKNRSGMGGLARNLSSRVVSRLVSPFRPSESLGTKRTRADSAASDGLPGARPTDDSEVGKENESVEKRQRTTEPAPLSRTPRRYF